MAVAYKSKGSAAGNATSLSVPWGTHSAGDIGLLFVESQTNEVTLSTSRGFQKIGSTISATGTRLDVWWLRATSSGMLNPIVSAAGNHSYGVIIVYSGCIETGEPFSTYASDVKNTASTTTVNPAITTTIADSLIVLGLTKDLDSTAAFVSSGSNSNLVSLTERHDAGTNIGDGGGVAVYDGTKATAGDTGTTSFTVTSSRSAMITIALIPPVTSPGTTVSITEGTQQTLNNTRANNNNIATTNGSQQEMSGTRKTGVSFSLSIGEQISIEYLYAVMEEYSTIVEVTNGFNQSYLATKDNITTFNLSQGENISLAYSVVINEEHSGSIVITNGLNQLIESNKNADAQIDNNISEQITVIYSVGGSEDYLGFITISNGLNQEVSSTKKSFDGSISFEIGDVVSVGGTRYRILDINKKLRLSGLIITKVSGNGDITKNVYLKAVVKKPVLSGEIVKVIRTISSITKVRRYIWNAN